MTETPIIEMLENIGKTPVRFAMPGHKGRGSEAARYDITELPGADNLYAPEGAIARSEELCAREFGAVRAMMSVCGSTACVLAMIGYFPRHSKIIMARDFHLSAKNAIDIFGIEPVFVEVEMRLGALQQTAAAADFEKAIAENPDAAAVYLTYPNPYGICADVERIARAAHGAGMMVLADSAHGAHFGVSGLPKTAGELGADIWSVSFHKTLPALNQAAVLFCSENVDAARDSFEIKLCRAFSATGKPMLGICRGHQIITVAFGGTLHQDIGKELGVTHPNPWRHSLVIRPDTFLRGIFGAQHEVNSTHHQATLTTPPGFMVTAFAPDGVVEAMQAADGRPIYSVQFHPERLYRDDPAALEIFKLLI